MNRQELHSQQIRVGAQETAAKRRRALCLLAVAVVLVGLPLGFILSRYPPFGGLHLPCLRHGRVVDADTGKPVAGAVVSVRWRIYDYPMLDGAGSYEVSVQAGTDADGQFTLPLPAHRKGFFNTETHPPYITAPGYRDRDFASSDSPGGGSTPVYPMRKQ